MDMTPEQWAGELERMAVETRRLDEQQRAKIRAAERGVRLTVLRDFLGEKGKAERATAAETLVSTIARDLSAIQSRAHSSIDAKWAEYKSSLAPAKRRIRKEIKARLVAEAHG